MSSTGLKVVWICVSSHFVNINLFGFNPDKQFHYYEKNRPGYKPTDSHDYEKEKQIIKGFEREGKLKIYS